MLAGAATAGSVPLPPPPTTVPTVTDPVPVPAPLPVPVPKLPPVLPQPVSTTVPSAPASSTTQASSTLTATLSSATGGVSGAAASSSGSSPGSADGSASGSSSGSSSTLFSGAHGGNGTQVDHFHSSRTWIGTTGPRGRRTTTLTFVLQRSGRVIFIVNEVSPECVGIGRFSVAGRRGLNRIRFAGVVRGHRLTPGTYRISIHTPDGRVVRRVTIVVVGGSAPTDEQLRALKAANTCHGEGTAAAVYTTASGAGDSGPTPGTLPAQKLPRPKPAAAAIGPTGVLASGVERTARAIQPLLVALLALAILLLGVASLPREAVPGPRVHDTLARHRVELVGLGAGVLVAVAIAVLLS